MWHGYFIVEKGNIGANRSEWDPIEGQSEEP